jgi:hypothetical protein
MDTSQETGAPIMQQRNTFISILVTAILLTTGYSLLSAAPSVAPGAGALAGENSADRLAIVWTSGDPDVAHRMALMYANGAQTRGWFDEVRLVIWGPSQRLVIGDKDIRDYIKRLIEAGVVVEACLACADLYGIADDLRAISGVEVKYMGEPLSDFLKSDEWHVMTF